MAARVLILIPIVLVVAQSTEAQQAVNEGASPPSYGQAFLEGALMGDDYSRAGFGLAAGVDLPRRLALHVEAEIPTWYSVRDVGRGSTGALELNYSTRTSAYTVLIGRRFGANPRIHLEALGGFAALFDSYKAKGYFDNLAPDGSVAVHSPYDDHGTEHFLGLTLGLDMPVRLGRHLSLVPKLRGHGTVANWRGPTARRAELAMRWRF
jgi:hypothetical protein